MKFKRAIFYGICIFIASYLLGEIASLIIIPIIGADKAYEFTQTFSFLLIGQIIMVAIIAFFAFLYLRNEKLNRKTIEGFYFGLLVWTIGIIIGILLRFYIYLNQDIVIEIFPNLLSLKFWEEIIFFVAICTIVGFLMSKQYIRIKKRIINKK